MNGDLRRLRESLTLSRRELAKRAEEDESTVYRAEHGLTALRPSTIQKLVRLLKASPTKMASANSRSGDDGRMREQ